MTWPPAGIDTMSPTPPVPEAEHADPRGAKHVHVALLSALGRLSMTLAPTTSEGPALEATMVYLTVEPGTAEGEPSVFEMLRSDVPTRVSVSVEVLSVGLVSVTPVGVVTVAVLANVPVAAESSDAVNV